MDIEKLAPVFETLLGLTFSSTGEPIHESGYDALGPDHNINTNQDVEMEDVIEEDEEGEIRSHTEMMGSKRTRAKNDRRRKQAIAKQVERKNQLDHEWSIRADEQKIIMSSLLGEPVERIHVHNLSWDSKYLANIKALEVNRNSPISCHDVEFKRLNTKWIHEPGVHIGIRQATRKIVFMLRIIAWEEMPPNLRRDTQANLQTLMDWTTCVHVIKNNSAQNHPQAYIDCQKALHGKDISVTTTQKLYGKMYGVGWHQSMEAGKTLAYYAPNSCTDKTLKQYEELLAKLPAVAEMFKTRFCYLFPAGAKSLIETSREGNIPSFDNYLDGKSRTCPFSNCLTLTNDDFANFQHRDKDHIAVAYGLWWTSARALTPEGQVYSFSGGLDHDQIDGGEFLWGEYGIGVDFQRACGLVEIFWRGKHDFHSTMLSNSPENATRWGTSVQLTQRGVNAVAKYWELGNFERVCTPQERIQTAYKRAEKSKVQSKKKITSPRKDKAKAALMKQMRASTSRESSVGPFQGSSRLRK